MSRYGSTGVIQLHYVPSIADKTAPTTTEIDAGTDLSGFLLRDGLSTPLPGSTMDTADVSSDYSKTGRGSFGAEPISVTLHRDDAADTAWDTLPRATTGFLVVARQGGSGAGGDLAAGDPVEVWDIDVISREPVDIADNQTQRFVATCAVPDTPELDAVVA